VEIVGILTVVSSYWLWKPRQTRRSERWVSSFPFSKNTKTETQVSIYIFLAGRPFGPVGAAYSIPGSNAQHLKAVSEHGLIEIRVLKPS